MEALSARNYASSGVARDGATDARGPTEVNGAPFRARGAGEGGEGDGGSKGGEEAWRAAVNRVLHEPTLAARQGQQVDEQAVTEAAVRAALQALKPGAPGAT